MQKKLLSFALIYMAILSAIFAADKKPSSAMTITASPSKGVIGQSLQNEVDAAIDRSLDWLASIQKEDGSWSNSSFPALTGLALQAFINSSHPNKDEIVAKAKKYILSCVQDDGGIYKVIKDHKGGGLSNYNTAICMTALHMTGDKDVIPVVLKARKFIAGSQHFGDDIYKGGFGYDAKTHRAYTDGLNTMYAMEAMVRTQSAEDHRPEGEQKVDIDWTETVKFVSSLQNKEGSGKENEGGFIYRPGESKAGSTTNSEGKVVFRSYGSMTYVGLLTLIYAHVDRDDVRVRSAFDWASKHWSLDENPGMGAQGLYFFYNVITKSLTAYGTDVVPQENDENLNWRAKLADKLVSLQKIDPKTGHGHWENKQGRFWESDPVLVTAYSLIALEML